MTKTKNCNDVITPLSLYETLEINGGRCFCECWKNDGSIYIHGAVPNYETCEVICEKRNMGMKSCDPM